MKASLKGRFEGDKTSAIATITANAGDVKLKSTFTDATVVKGPSVNGLTLSAEKPGSFVIDYNAAKQDVRFQFMNSLQVLDRPVSLTYTHAVGDARAAVDGTVVFDPANKVSGSYAFGSGEGKVKYVYAHGEMPQTVLEPSYDFSKNVWDFTVSRKLEGGDSVKAAYRTSSKALDLEWNRASKISGCLKMVLDPSYDFSKNVWDLAVSRKLEGGDSLRAIYRNSPTALDLEWSRDSKINGCFKVSASFNLAEQNIVPKLMAETTWNYEI